MPPRSRCPTIPADAVTAPHPELLGALELMLQALVENCAPFVEYDWPFDYEQGLCMWCETHKAHAEGCPWETARAYLYGNPA